MRLVLNSKAKPYAETLSSIQSKDSVPGAEEEVRHCRLTSVHRAFALKCGTIPRKGLVLEDGALLGFGLGDIHRAGDETPDRERGTKTIFI